MGTESGKLECDLVMRGGITSGIVYPRAIAKLAETYNFRSIGGTSAGAIAAAATAAAQFGVNTGHDHFQTIYDLPEKLAEVKDGKSVLERLFQPQQSTRRLFRLLMSGLERERPVAKVMRIVGTGLLAYWPYAIIGAAVTLIPLAWVANADTVVDARHAVLSAVALLLGLLTAIIGAALGVLRDVRNRLPENRYGLCSGSRNMQSDDAGVLPLTDWLHHFFQSVAGGTPIGDPVTFGDLWGNKGDENAPRDIELVLMTTNVTRGISAALPVSRRQLGSALLRRERVRRTLSEVRREMDDGPRPKAQERRQSRNSGSLLLLAEAGGPADPARRSHELELSYPAQRRAALCSEFRARAEAGQIPARAVLVFRWRTDQQFSDPLLRCAAPLAPDLRHQSRAG
jgi:hypothetical protein